MVVEPFWLNYLDVDVKEEMEKIPVAGNVDSLISFCEKLSTELATFEIFKGSGRSPAASNGIFGEANKKQAILGLVFAEAMSRLTMCDYAKAEAADLRDTGQMLEILAGKLPGSTSFLFGTT